MEEVVAETPASKTKVSTEGDAFRSFTYVRKDVELTPEKKLLKGLKG